MMATVSALAIPRPLPRRLGISGVLALAAASAACKRPDPAPPPPDVEPTPDACVADTPDGGLTLPVPSSAFRIVEALAGHVQRAAAERGRASATILTASADGTTFVGASQFTPMLDPCTDDLDHAAREAFRWTAAEGTLALGAPAGTPPVEVRPSALSADGRVVVGSVKDAATMQRAFRWTSDTGLVAIGDPGTEADGVSADGAVVIGTSSFAALRWTVAAGWKDLGRLIGTTRCLADRLSADGNVVIGRCVKASTGLSDALFRWTAVKGAMTALALPGFADALSAAGDVVVGSTFDASAPEKSQVFRWSEAGGAVLLGTLPGYSGSRLELSSPGDILSADGAVVVGSATSSEGDRAFRWAASGGMVGLGLEHDGGGATCSSMDGSVVTVNSFGRPALVWTAGGGLRKADELVAASGADAAGWSVTEACVSRNGAALFGTATARGSSSRAAFAWRIR
jgi:uncharacterized membrane protein